MIGTLTLVFEDDSEELSCSSDVFEMNALRPAANGTTGEVEFQLDETSNLFRRLHGLIHSPEAHYLTFVYDCPEEGKIYRFLRAYPAWMDSYEEPGAVGLVFQEYEFFCSGDDTCPTE